MMDAVYRMGCLTGDVWFRQAFGLDADAADGIGAFVGALQGLAPAPADLEVGGYIRLSLRSTA